MSDQIRVSTDTLDALASQLKALGGELSNASSRLTGIGMNLTTANYTIRNGGCRLSGNAGISGVSLGTTRSTVRSYGSALDAYDELCRRLAGSIQDVRDRFVTAEESISAIVDGGGTESEYLESSSNSVMEIPGIGKIYTKDGVAYFVDEDNSFGGAYDIGYTALGLFPATAYLPFAITNWAVTNETNQKFWSWLTSNGIDTGSEMELGKFKESTREHQYKKGDLVESKHTFAEVGFKQEGYDAIGLIEGGIQGENGSLKAKAGVGYYEGKIGGYAGIYGYDSNGNIVIAPGVRGEIGGSFSVIHADLEGSYDFGEYDVSGSVSADVGKVGGKAEAQLGWVDGELAVNAGVELEAVAYEVEGSIGVSNDYVGVEATGGVQFGVGVSADVGYHDGKFSIEASAALGLGVSGKIELDVSGAIDAAMGAFESFSEGAKAAYKGIQTFGSIFFG